MLKAISKRSAFLFLFDCAAIVLAYSLSFYSRSGRLPDALSDLPPFVFLAFFVVPAVFYVFDLYYPFKYFARVQTFVDVLLAVSLSLFILAAASYLDRSLVIARLLFVYAAIILIPLIYGIRLLYDLLFRSHVLDKKALIIGTGPIACEVVSALSSVPHSGLEIVGLVSETKGKKKAAGIQAPVIGGIDQLLSLIDWYNVEIVVLAMEDKENSSEAQLMGQLMMRKVTVTSAIHLFEKVTGEIPYRLLDDHFLLSLMSQVRMRPFLRVKRLLDIFAAITLLITLAPVLLLAVAGLALSGPQSIFFVQKRVGRDSRPFELYKLRTMTIKGKAKQMVTRFGRWLRKYRIDEVPQLVNVIKGDMSLVGPRPEVPYFVSRCRKKIPFYDSVFAIRPGLTGWAQVNHEHVTSIKDYDKKFRYNLFYLKNISMTLDLVILVRTIRVIVFGKGK